MEKVLYIVPDGDDLGGIYTSTENLLCGFREVKVEPTFILLRATKDQQRTVRTEPRLGSYVGEGTGYHLHPQYGWQGHYYSLGSAVDLDTLVRKANTGGYSVVIWGAMFGLRNKITEGSTHWLRLFKDIKVPHVCMIRDDHLADRYPWVAALEPWIAGWACVQRSSFDSCAGLTRPRAIIYSGHDTTVIAPPLSKRTPQLFMAHTFKSWKRADRLVAAVPHMKRGASVVLGGQGIEYFYMASKTKCKPRYYCTKTNDPDATRRMLGKPIWSNAIGTGMQHLGNLTAPKRDKVMQGCMFFVDLSWREHSTGQINRTIVEAIKNGCVPICNNRFITGRDDGKGELFKAGVHYIAAPSINSTPKQLAEFFDDVLANTSEADYLRMQRAGAKLIQRFSRKTAALNLLCLGKNAPGVFDDYDDNKKGRNRELIENGKTMFHQIFGGVR